MKRFYPEFTTRDENGHFTPFNSSIEASNMEEATSLFMHKARNGHFHVCSDVTIHPARKDEDTEHIRKMDMGIELK